MGWATSQLGVVGGTQGEREHVQRIGRLLRPGDGKEAVVYGLVMRGTAEVAQARIGNLVFCIDCERNVGDGDLPTGARVVRYKRRIDPVAVLGVIG